MNSGYKQILLIALIALVSSFTILAQEATISATRLQADYYKDQNGIESVVTRLLLKAERYEPFVKAEIQLFAVGDTSNILLKTIQTDAMGEAVFILQEQDLAYADSTGHIRFTVEYEGSPTTKSASKDVEVKAANLKVAFFQEDSSKFIAVEAFQTSPDGTPEPIAGLEIGLFVKGTFSYLDLAKDVTGEDGRLIVPFPVNMPGDTIGVITIAAKVEDNDEYGNIEAWGKINWAEIVPLAVEAKRGLGDTDAPLWMVYTLIVLLSAVWFHYAYVIFLIIKIKLAKHLT